MTFDSVLNRFPNIQLSYEKLIHKKVDSDYYMAIPYGKKYFAWFTHHNDRSICLLLEIYKKSQINNITQVVTCFKECLATNTVFYGTLVKNKYFFIEDICYYKNKDVSHYSDKQMFTTMKYIFNHEIRQVNCVKNQTIFGLPLMSISYSGLLSSVFDLPYKTYSIQCRYAYGKKTKKYLLYKPEYNNLVFRIKAEVKNDIYSLYCINNGREEYYDMAYIPDYKTSVYMNGFFRNIKENDNLDALEESDDEDEFENISEDKFIKTNESYDFICEFNDKFKKWVPIKKVENKSIVQRKSLISL